MSAAYFKRIFMVLLVASFATNSYAGWNWKRSSTQCVNGNCHHATTKKHCNNGHCEVWRRSSTWHR